MIKYITPRTLIRELNLDDLQSFIKLMIDPNINRYLNPTGASLDIPSAEAVLNYVVAKYNTESPIYLYGVTKNDTIEKVVGLVSYKMINEEEVEIFGALSPLLWGSRVSNEMIEGLIQYIFTSTCFKSIIIYVKQENRSAKALAQKLGFKSKGLIYNSVFENEVDLLSLLKIDYMNCLTKI